jgi:outer membrane protein OmpA-like peptidoglycan-associated protein
MRTSAGPFGRRVGLRCVAAVTGIALLAAVSGCTTDAYTGEKEVSKTAIGAVIGAAAGAGIGALANKRNRAKGALIGAGVGGLAGGAVGAYMDVQEKKLREQLQGTGVSVTRQGDDIILNMPGNVTFATDSAEIKSNFYSVLNSVALVVKEYDKTIIEVTGHTDNTGSDAYNQTLSEKRAGSVGDYIKGQGINPQRVLTQGFGEQLPVADNGTPTGREQNRRVELRLVPLTA